MSYNGITSTTHVISGCGPGLGVAPDTPQEGVRSVLSRDTQDMDARLWTKICQAHIHPRKDAADYTALARLAQQIADMAHTMAGRVK